MTGYQQFSDDSPNEVPVRGFVHGPMDSDQDCLVLTHGAGSNCKSPLLVTLSDAFCASGWTVLRCDLAFRQLRPNGPPRGSAERDQQGLRAAVASMRHHTQGRVFLGGHSYGGRQASMLAADQPGLIERLLLLSYPLHPPKRPAELRIKHFPALQVPAFFVHGTRDSFGSILEMEEALKTIPGATKLMPIPGAGHELMTNRTGNKVAGQVVTGFL